MDPARPRAEAVFVENGLIKVVGDKKSLLTIADADTKRIDLEGGFLVPGLIETLNHLSLYAMYMEHCYLGGGRFKTIQETINGLRLHKAEHEKSDYFVGYGYDDTFTDELRHLTKEDLDLVSLDKPVLVHHMSGHGGYVNTCALKQFGITKETEDPPGGKIERDEEGNPTGRFEEMAWFNLTGEKTPFPMNLDIIERLLKKAVQDFNSYGIVAVHDAAVGIGGNGSSVVNAYKSLEEKGELNIRAFMSWMLQADPDYIPEQIHNQGMGKRKAVVGGVKFFVDGSIQMCTAALLSPYKNKPDFMGDLIVSAVEFEETIAKHHKNGDHISVHANGDAAIEAAITAFEKAQKIRFRKNTRHMIIHCQMASEDHISRMKATGIIPSFFGMHINYYGDRHKDLFLGKTRSARLDPCGDAIRAGLDFTLHTDTPVMPPWLMESIGTAVTRRTRGGEILGPDQSIRPVEALAAYTTMAAKCSYSEHQRGVISVGKLADFTLLSQDITRCDPDEIKKTQILKTILENKIVFEA